MPESPISRRTALHGFALAVPISRAMLAAAPRTAADHAQAGVRLQVVPTRLYKLADASREQTESWIFWLFVESDQSHDVRATSLVVTSRRQGATLATRSLAEAALTAMALRPPAPTRQLDGQPLVSPVHRPLALRIRCSEPVSLNVDEVVLELVLAEGAESRRLSLTLPCERYQQRTSLIFPFRGRGLVTKTGVTNGGHTNRSGQFAIDVIGLSAQYGVYAGPGTRASADYAGWEREIIAPAAGEVVHVRADRPDQPDPETSDPSYFAPEFKQNGDPGNHVIIRHGPGEFSMIAHLRAGSVRVRSGEHVTQGHPLGRLGSSGDTVTPHVHYQLQDGPDWQYADGLPCTFVNVGNGALVRGQFFETT